LQRVVTETLTSRLPYIPITYPITWGISVDWDGPGAYPQAINAWPEIYVGHLYWPQRARRRRQAGCDELVQFIGIDNGFYNAFVYLTLKLLAARHGLPIEMPVTRTLTNQYFMLEGRKFSTSKGDVLWARNYLESVGQDRARFVLSLTSPELQQSEFTEQVASSTLATRFDKPLAVIEAALNGRLAGRGIDAPPSQWWSTAIAASLRRFTTAYSLETFSIRKAAEALAQHLEVLALRGGQVRVDDTSDVAGALLFLWTLRTLGWPVTPDLSDKVTLAFGAEAAHRDVPLLRDVTTPPAGQFQGIALSPRADVTPDAGFTAVSHRNYTGSGASW
jgi:methionyl-tRNA synthetase